MSTLSAAIDLVHAMSERRRGRDPSAQEDRAVAAAYLRESADELEDQVLAIRASLVAGSDDSEKDGVIRMSRRMNEVLILNHVARRLHVMHQRLLSLYPDVPEVLIEDARLLAARCARLRDRLEDFRGDLEAELLGTLTDLNRFRSEVIRLV